MMPTDVGLPFNRNGLCCLIVLAGATAVWGFQLAEEVLFTRARTQVIDNLRRFPRYVCVRTIVRSQYELPRSGSSCAAAISNTGRYSAERVLRWRDRLRLDVAVGEKGEMYSWAGASKFESGDITDVVSRGATGDGEFGSFLTGVFGGDAEHFVYRGEKDSPTGRLALFEFTVPVSKSHYEYSSESKGGYKVMGYQGSFLVDPVTADLRQMDIAANTFPQSDAICSVQNKIEYERTKIGEETFMLPKSGVMDVIYRNSSQTVNETSFSGCREYTGDSTIRFDVDESGNVADAAKRPELKPLPPKTHLRVRIDPPIDSDVAATGDPIIGVVTAAVKEKGVVLVNAGDKLRGRIVRMEQTLGARPQWTVAMVFETIERGGIEQKVSLKANDDGDRGGPALSRDLALGRRGLAPIGVNTIISERPAGGGIFSFQEAGHLVLDRKFESEWETR